MNARHSLSADLVAGVFMAVLLTAMAALPLGFIGLVNLAASAGWTEPVMSWAEYGMFWLVIPGSYLVASVAGATAFWALRPLRRFALGYGLTGAALSVIAYGTIGLALAIFYEPVGRIFLENSSREEAWEMVPGVVSALAPIGFLFGLWQWYKDR